MAKPLPTIQDVRDRLTELCARGLGHLPAQLLVVPDATLQALYMALASEGLRPALMIDLLPDGSPDRPAVCLTSTELAV